MSPMVTACLLVGWVPLWGRTSGRYGDPDVWWADRKQAQLIRDFQPDMIMVTPSYALT